MHIPLLHANMLLQRTGKNKTCRDTWRDVKELWDNEAVPHRSLSLAKCLSLDSIAGDRLWRGLGARWGEGARGRSVGGLSLPKLPATRGSRGQESNWWRSFPFALAFPWERGIWLHLITTPFVLALARLHNDLTSQVVPHTLSPSGWVMKKVGTTFLTCHQPLPNRPIYFRRKTTFTSFDA